MAAKVATIPASCRHQEQAGWHLHPTHNKTALNSQHTAIPTAAAIFPAEMSEWPPKSYVDRIFNITQWTEMPSGGHFAALEEPELLVNDLVKFSRTVR